jgi:hypothetical protein
MVRISKCRLPPPPPPRIPSPAPSQAFLQRGVDSGGGRSRWDRRGHRGGWEVLAAGLDDLFLVRLGGGVGVVFRIGHGGPRGAAGLGRRPVAVSGPGAGLAAGYGLATYRARRARGSSVVIVIVIVLLDDTGWAAMGRCRVQHGHRSVGHTHALGPSFRRQLRGLGWSRRVGGRVG